MKRISEPFETLSYNKKPGERLCTTDVLVIGSGYGGAVAAMRLACEESESGENKREVVVLERGREYGLGDFPYDIEDIPSHLRVTGGPRGPGGDGNGGGYSDGLFNIHVGNYESAGSEKTSPVDVLVGSRLGGTSLINANVAEKPSRRVFRKGAWPEVFRKNPTVLDAAYDEVEAKLGVTTRSGTGGREFPKYTALRRLAEKSDISLRPANIAVTTQNSTNGVGVQQNPCTDCGNCVTGCNVGAKNTLDRNLLRLAKSRGAIFYTQVTALSIEPTGDEAYRWQVNVRSTTQEGTYLMRAKQVILAAGTLGSTEILFRSQKKHKFEFSSKLGHHFSTNGDGIVMSYGQKGRVGAVASAEQGVPSRRTGPTITGIMRPGNMTIEEASVPAALARVFAELVTTGAMLQRLSKRKLPYLLKKERGRDPLAASMEVAEHCQAFLVMGDDRAPGQLLERGGDEGLDIRFPEVKAIESLNTANELFRKQDRKKGLDKGQYVPNPLWELLPEEAGGVMSGDMPQGRALTVHPLGGCAMADDVKNGVVNSDGQVFNPLGPAGGVHEGLYVFDGAIVPCALEVNPFMTIAALAWRNCDTILESSQGQSSIEQVSGPYASLGQVPSRYRVRPQATGFRIQEQLTGEVEGDIPFFDTIDPKARARIGKKQGLVVEVTAHHANGEQWLENPGAQPLSAVMTLSHNMLSEKEVNDFRPVGVRQAHRMPNFLELQGRFTILAEDDYGWFHGSLGKRGVWGGLRAIRTYIRRRGWSALSSTSHTPEDPPRGLRKWLERLESGRIFLNLGVLQSRRRRLRYEFRNPEAGISIKGQKVLAYSHEKRMWPALLELDLTFEDGDGNACTATVRVSPENLLDPGLLQVERSAHLPQSLLFTGGAAAYFARSMVTTNFWEFGGVAYKENNADCEGGITDRGGATDKVSTTCKEADSPPKPGDLVVNGRRIPPEPVITFDVPLKQEGSTRIELELTRYKREGRQPLLLIHGLAQGSQIFWTESLKTNLAAYGYGYGEGYDVWLLDYRLSNRILPDLPGYDWSLDEIALFDIPMAIEKVREQTGKKVSIITHCVGASALAMAILGDESAKGDELHTKIHRIVSNAIHPWVITSAANRFRAKFGALYREWIPGDTLLNPLPEKGEGAMQNVMDRLGFGLARLAEQEQDKHQDHDTSEWSQSICDRMTFLYGRMWNHKNLEDATHEEFGKMLGSAPIGVYQHLYYYSELRRLTDSKGANRFLQTKKIQENWTIPTLFIHGGDSQVFNPHSARRSAVRMNLAIRNFDGRDKLDSMTVPVGYEIFEGYGHMDPILGKNAHEECYPEYFEFFADPKGYVKDPIKDPDSPTPYAARPDTGPILRAAWIENDKIRLRYWAEMKTQLVVRPKGLVINQGPIPVIDVENEMRVPYGPDASGPRYRYADVEVDLTRPDLEINIGSDIPLSTAVKQPYDELIYKNEAWLERLRTYSAERNPAMSFLVGSCRFPGSIVDNRMSDGIFRAMRSHINATGGAQLLFLVGDQIYADATDQLFEARSSRTRYRDRYRRAFRHKFSPSFSGLVRHVPTHFALDDHEIDNNWSGLPPKADSESVSELEFSLNEAARYMGSARNQRPVPASSASPKSPFYYALAAPQESDFPVFVADTRTERQFRQHNNPSRYAIMGEDQYTMLEGWLTDAHDDFPDAPKFIVSGSIVAPLSSFSVAEKRVWRAEDGWAGYPATLERLLKFIADKEIQKVVFVGGDAHMSSVSRLELETAVKPGITTEVWQIVSSGLYAPLPFANSHRENFNWPAEDPACPRRDELQMHVEKTMTVHCTNHFLSDHYQQFVSVDAREDSITVSCHRLDSEKPVEYRIVF